jgi:hypothetical protein
VVAEEIADDREEDPDPDHEQEDLEDGEKQVAEADVCERQVKDPFGLRIDDYAADAKPNRPFSHHSMRVIRSPA